MSDTWPTPEERCICTKCRTGEATTDYYAEQYEWCAADAIRKAERDALWKGYELGWNKHFRENYGEGLIPTLKERGHAE